MKFAAMRTIRNYWRCIIGTNFYAHREACPHCRRSQSKYHIGKSSGGWCFSIHVDRFEGVENLADLYKILEAPGTVILDEYDREISLEDMKYIIERHEPCHLKKLQRHPIDGRLCVGHGEGNSDYLKGEFS